MDSAQTIFDKRFKLQVHVPSCRAFRDALSETLVDTADHPGHCLSGRSERAVVQIDAPFPTLRLKAKSLKMVEHRVRGVSGFDVHAVRPRCSRCNDGLRAVASSDRAGERRNELLASPAWVNERIAETWSPSRASARRLGSYGASSNKFVEVVPRRRDMNAQASRERGGCHRTAGLFQGGDHSLGHHEMNVTSSTQLRKATP